MPTRCIETDTELDSLIRLLRTYAKPYVVSITKGKRRSPEQNATQFLWLGEAAEQLQDESIEEKRAWCKLHLGVPILRNENAAFREQYDQVIRPLPYEAKLAIMRAPIDLPVTSLMTVRQQWQYMTEMQQHFERQGVRLTIPNEPDWDAMLAKGRKAWADVPDANKWVEEQRGA